MKEVFQNVKKYLSYFIAGLIIIILAIPFFIGLFYLWTRNKSIQFTPEFKIIDIQSKEQDDLSASKEAVNKALEIVKGIK